MDFWTVEIGNKLHSTEHANQLISYHTMFICLYHIDVSQHLLHVVIAQTTLQSDAVK